MDRGGSTLGARRQRPLNVGRKRRIQEAPWGEFRPSLPLPVAVRLPGPRSAWRNQTERAGTQRQRLSERYSRLLSQDRVRARLSQIAIVDFESPWGHELSPCFGWIVSCGETVTPGVTPADW